VTNAPSRSSASSPVVANANETRLPGDEERRSGFTLRNEQDSSGSDGRERERSGAWRREGGQKGETESNSFADALTAAGVTAYYSSRAARWLFLANFESDFN